MQFILEDKSICSSGLDTVKKEAAIIPAGRDNPGVWQALAHLLDNLEACCVGQVHLNQDMRRPFLRS